jgi:nitroreductase
MNRVPEYPIIDLLSDRWSPRAMSGEPLTHDELFTLFEAARWAPSSYNNQPWRYIYAQTGTPEFAVFLDLLVESNRIWAVRAGALILMISRSLFFYNDAPSRTHSFDAGAAAENLALQGYSMGLVVHGMEGFDYDRARTVLGVPNDYTIEALFAVGRKGDVTQLPEKLQQRETPSDRKPVEELVFKGAFGKAPE